MSQITQMTIIKTKLTNERSEMPMPRYTEVKQRLVPEDGVWAASARAVAAGPKQTVTAWAGALEPSPRSRRRT